jgi:hypothetical protein
MNLRTYPKIGKPLFIFKNSRFLNIKSEISQFLGYCTGTFLDGSPAFD